MQLEFLVSLNVFIISLFLVNGLQSLYVNTVCLRCIFGKNLSLINKNLFLVLFVLYFETREDLAKKFD